MNGDEMGKQIVDSNGRIKCKMCGKRYFESGINAHSVSCLKKMSNRNIYFEPAKMF